MPPSQQFDVAVFSKASPACDSSQFFSSIFGARYSCDRLPASRLQSGFHGRMITKKQ